MNNPIVSLFGFLLTRDDWNELDAEERQVFRRMLAEDGASFRWHEQEDGAKASSYHMLPA